MSRRYLLLGGPHDGMIVEATGGPTVVVPRHPIATTWTEDDPGLERVGLRCAVYGPPALRHPDRNPDLHALEFRGYEYR